MMQYGRWLLPFIFVCVFQLAWAEPATDHSEDAENADELVVSNFLDKLTPNEKSVLQHRLEQEKQEKKTRFLLKTYRPNYLLPYYYTASPDYAVYAGDIPDDQPLRKTEFSGQLSLRMPLWENIYNSGYSLQAGYTQLVFWQLYTESAWFRETNYEPEIFLTHQPHRNWLLSYGLNHQSNGQGGDRERSWNRAYVDVLASGGNWLVGLRVWALVFEEQSADIYNPDIADYLGHERILVAYKLGQHTFSASARNLEWIDHAAYEVTWSYPITDNLGLYAQAFSGYGQSLIEYNHRTNAFGLGLIINDWI